MPIISTIMLLTFADAYASPALDQHWEYLHRAYWVDVVSY